MNRATKLIVVVASIVVFSYAALGYVLNRNDDEKSYKSLTVYGEVLQRIQEEYVEEPNMQKVTAGALHGLVESLDSLSSYMSPQEYADYQKQIAARPAAQAGVVLSKRYGYIQVVSTEQGGAAEKAGIRPGDVLEAIGGFTTRELSDEQSAIMLRGVPGTNVKVSVLRGGATTETEDKTITLEPPVSLPVTVTKLSPDTAYLRVPVLTAGKADELRAKLADLDHNGVKKVILDVRGCAEGEDSEGIAAARLFVPSGMIASLSGQTVAKQEFPADPSKVVWKNPVVVLTSGATSGAAEILAAAISGNKRGEVVGERTYGVASQQKLLQLADGAAVNITVALYYTPDGKRILEDGVAPTVEVTNPTDDLTAYGRAENPALVPADPKNDLVLSKALDILAGTAPTGVAERRPPLRSLRPGSVATE
jgi:carboxyl-terminal processing protease